MRELARKSLKFRISNAIRMLLIPLIVKNLLTKRLMFRWNAVHVTSAQIDGYVSKDLGLLMSEYSFPVTGLNSYDYVTEAIIDIQKEHKL